MNMLLDNISARNPEFIGIRVMMWACMVLFAVMSVFRLATMDYVSASFYLAALLIMGSFSLHVTKSGGYSRNVWFAESLFFLVWLAGIRIGAGAVQIGVDAGAIAVIAFAVVMGSGIRKLLVVMLAVALPILLRALETSWSSDLYVPRPIHVSKIGTGVAVLSVAVIVSLLIDRVTAAYFRQREIVGERLRQLSRMMVIDGMTGLINQSHLFERLAEEVDRARRNRTVLSVLMLDIDDFKQVNDSLGHLAGDVAITCVASVLRELVVPPEFAGRRGGDEFVVVLPDVSVDGAIEMAERIRSRVFQDFGGGESAPAPLVTERFRGVCPPMTVSVGVAEWSSETPDKLLTIVEGRLRDAKVNGKNCVVAFD